MYNTKRRNIDKCMKISAIKASKVKQSHYKPWRRLEGEQIQLLIVLDVGSIWH
jgi:hypothetical protein